MTDLLAIWKWKNYVADLAEGPGFDFNSNQRRLRDAIDVGESLWLVSGEPSPSGAVYRLVGRLVITAKTLNAPGYTYGRYRVWGGRDASAIFAADGPDASGLLLSLSFDPHGPIESAKKIGNAIQTMRALTPGDVALLGSWARALPLEPRAYEVADELALERAYATGEAEVDAIVTRVHTGVSDDRRAHLRRSYPRNRSLVARLQEMYDGRCQMCGFDPVASYGVRACEGHHLTHLSRGGADDLGNLMLLCPNHHAVIHAVGAVFDYADLRYVFADGRHEGLAINRHLQASSGAG